MPSLPFRPLFETVEFRPVGKPVLVEDASTPGRQVTRQSGTFQNFLKQNANKRTYPKGIWEGLFKDGSDFMNRIKNRAMIGLLEHPEDGVTRLDRIPSHLIVEVHFATPQEINETRNDKHPIEEGDIVGTLEVLGTSTGKELLALIEAGVLFGVSSRGGGSLREDGDGYIVENDFECETWDVVAVPSVQRATPHVTTRTTEAAPAPARPVVTERRVQAQDAINRYVLDIAHARKTGDTQKLEQEKAALIQFMQKIGRDYRHDPEVLDAVTESCWAAKHPMEIDRYLANPDGAYLVRQAQSGDQSAKKYLRDWAAKCGEVGKNHQFLQSLIAETETPSASPTPKLTESTKPSMKTIRDLQIELTQLRATPLKGLKPTDRANIIEAVLQMQVNLGKILVEDASQKPLADRLGKHLNEFMDDLDEPETVDATPAAPAAGEGDEEGGEGNETIQAAADKLRELAPEDEAVTELADELEALSDECAPVDDDSAPVEGEPVSETIKRLRKKLATESAKRTRVESTLSKLSKASAKLVERHNAVLARVKTLGESGSKDGEAMKAARELATRYNRDMIEFASLQLQRTRPALTEANAPALNACKTWNAYSALVERLIKADARKPKARITEAGDGDEWLKSREGATLVREIRSGNPEAKREAQADLKHRAAKAGCTAQTDPELFALLSEAAPAPGTKPKYASRFIRAAVKPALTEAVANHPSLRMATRHRPVAA